MNAWWIMASIGIGIAVTLIAMWRWAKRRERKEISERVRDFVWKQGADLW